MNVKEFWESDKHLAIHCDTKEKAKKLLKIFTLQGHKWARDIPYTQSGWSFEKQDMCYDNKGAFGNIHAYKVAKVEIIEFNDLDEFKPFVAQNGVKMPNNITSRAWRTYNLIKKNSLEDKWTDKREIVENDKFDAQSNPTGYIYHDRSHDICSGIWSDIEMLNSTIGLKLIIADGKNKFKMAKNKAEAEEYTQRLKDKAIKILVRCSIYTQKMKMDGQGKLLNVRLDPIEEQSKAEKFIETYLR